MILLTFELQKKTKYEPQPPVIMKITFLHIKLLSALLSKVCRVSVIAFVSRSSLDTKKEFNLNQVQNLCMNHDNPKRVIRAICANNSFLFKWVLFVPWRMLCYLLPHLKGKISPTHMLLWEWASGLSQKAGPALHFAGSHMTNSINVQEKIVSHLSVLSKFFTI